MKRLLALFLALSLCPATFGSELFPFVISFDAPKNITNISHHLDAPAGKHGFVRVVDGHFATDNGRIRFWGTNTCFAANFHDKATADRMADRLARFGTNCVRLHHIDMHDIWGGSNARTFMTFDPAQLDRLDYFVYALKQRGIYVNLNLHVSRSLDERDGFPPNVNRPSHDKGIDNYYRPLIDANKKYAKDLLEHVNPYTGVAYKDEPAVAMIEINNEDSILNTWGGWGDLHQIRDPFLAELRRLWNEWLIEKYKDDAALRTAWRARNEPLGNEMLRNGNFDNGYVPSYDGWHWETNANSDAPIANVNGVLRMDVKHRGDVAWHPQLIASPFAVKKDQLYTLEFRARADITVPLDVGVRMNHAPWEGLGFDTNVTLSTEWRTFRLTFVPVLDDDNARVTINNFREGIVYEFDFVSLKPGGTVGLPLEQHLREEMLQNGDFANGYTPNNDGWRWETDDQTDAPVSNVNGALRLDVKRKGNVAWNPQLSSGSFAVQEGEEYTLTVVAKASRGASLLIRLGMNHEPWGGLGYDEHINLTTQWQTVTRTFRPNADDNNARLVFGDLQEGVVYDIQSVSLKPGRDDVPEKESSLAAKTVPVIWKKDAGQYPKEAVDDFIDFLFDVEAEYWDEMYRFLKDEIKVKQLVSGTQVEYGSIHAQAKMDYIDYHAYWNHPVFPRRQWDQNDWYISNRALVNHLDREILGPMATKRVYGMPFTVSEYNHPSPNQYAAEGLPLLAAFGAFQNWDGFFPFAYSHSRDAEPQRITSFFDTSGNTVQTAHMIACKMLFNAEIGVRPEQTIIAPLTAEKEREIFKRDRHQYNIGFSGLGINPVVALTNRTAIDVSGKVTEMPVWQETPLPSSYWQLNSAFPDRYGIQWLTGTGNRGVWTSILFSKSEEGGRVQVNTPRVGLFTGFVEAEQKGYTLVSRYPLGVSLTFDTKPNLGWATATLTRLDDEKAGEPERYLFVITGETRNTDMVLESLGGDRITVGNRWGRAPVLCEGVAVKIFWECVGSEKVRAWALDESGNRRQEIPITYGGGGATIETKPEYKTIWYEIEVAR